MGFSDVQVTDTAIYAVFQGDTFEEISRKMQKGDMTDGGRYIYVFSLSLIHIFILAKSPKS